MAVSDPFQQQPIFDSKKFLTYFEEMEDVAVLVATSVLTEMPIFLEKLGKSAVDQDFREMEIAAHMLKSAVSNIHAEPSRLAAERLELYARSRPDGLSFDSLLENLRSELTRLQPELRAWLADRGIHAK